MFIGTLCGAIAGICYSLLIPIVSSVLAVADTADLDADRYHVDMLSLDISRPGFALAFVGLCVAIFFARLVSRMLLSNVSIDLVADLRLRLCRKITEAPTATLESIGHARLQAALTEDVNRMIVGAQLLPLALMNLVSILGCLGFLAYINFSIFRLVIFVIAIGVVTYQIPMLLGSRMFQKSRQALDELQIALDGVTRGAKDLKMNRAKRDTFFAEVLETRQTKLRSRDKSAHNIYIAAEAYGDMLGFLVIGVVAFVVANLYSVNSTDLLGAVLALQYVSGPIAFLLGSLPPIAKARSSSQNVHRLLGDINEEPIQLITPPPAWNALELVGVTYIHSTSDSRDSYAVGPIDLEIFKGEITFIVGGNGSGKSTLGKVLSLHYPPAQGSLRIDGQVLERHSVESYRQCICAILPDYYLFDRLLFADVARESKAVGYLARLGLQGKVRIENGIFSTVKLSDGQRRRLALLVALVEDKEMYIFDEWAADQDPIFKRIFYHEILPELRSQGKAVVVISHDDRYFEVADTLVSMEDGQIIEQRRAIQSLTDGVRKSK